jgi:DNA-binding SARP family transcriptional activator/TolB-like protein/Tfp pilus assembly protein PilF
MSRDALADLLWSDRGGVQARSSLRQTIFELQHFGGEDAPILVVGRDELAVRRTILTTDIELIRDAASKGDWARLLALLEGAEPGLLADLDGLDAEFDNWLRSERAQEPERSLAATVGVVGRCHSEAGPRAALDLVSAILRIDPVDEEATRHALRIDHEIGDRGALHRHFTALRDRLAQDYDAEPSAKTTELFARLANGDASPARIEEPPTAVAGIARPQPSLRRRQAIAPLLVLVVAANALFGLALWDKSRAASTPPNAVVAVLPFDHQARDDFLAAGLWEQTRAALTRNPSIGILGRTTTAAMAEQKLAPDQYLKRLGVTHLLEGTVRRRGRELLVSVSLTRTNDGVIAWQDRFRGRMGEPFALEEAIANGIEGKLRARLAPGGGRKAEQIATTPEVYALYSEARQLNASRERANFQRAESLLRQAVKADPNYAPAWSLLGAAIYFNGRIAIVDAESRAKGTSAVKHAIAMAPNFAPAHAALALIKGEGAPEAEARLRRAVTLDPSYSEAWNWLGNSLVFQARYREAESAYERAVALDPLFAPAVSNLTIMTVELNDTAAFGRLLSRIKRAGASPELVDSVKAEKAYSSGDYSGALQLLSNSGVDASGRPKRLLWLNWFESLAATGHYDALHRINGCPDWYAPLLKGERLPPKIFEGKPVTPEEFWTSLFFSAPASRAMVDLGQSRELVALYRAGFGNADAFISGTTQRDLLPELAVNVAVAMKRQGMDEEAAYLLNAASRQLEQVLGRFPSRKATGRLALVRSAQGERAQALSLLETALGRGWLPNGHTITLDLAKEPAFAELRGHPRFEAARKRIRTHIEKERVELGPLKV